MSKARRRRPPGYWLSMALLLAAAGSVVGFFWLGGFFASQRGGPDPAYMREVEALNRQMSLLRGIVIKGKDEQGRPYEIRAASSRRDEKGRDVIHLRQVAGKVEQDAGPPLFFQAKRGLLHEKTRRFDLLDDAVIRKPGKWRLEGPAFSFDSETYDLSSDRPVVAHLDDGVIHARGMRTQGEGRIIHFLGPVRARFGEQVATGKQARQITPRPSAETSTPE